MSTPERETSTPPSTPREALIRAIIDSRHSGHQLWEDPTHAEEFFGSPEELADAILDALPELRPRPRRPLAPCSAKGVAVTINVADIDEVRGWLTEAYEACARQERERLREKWATRDQAGYGADWLLADPDDT